MSHARRYDRVVGDGAVALLLLTTGTTGCDVDGERSCLRLFIFWKTSTFVENERVPPFRLLLVSNSLIACLLSLPYLIPLLSLFLMAREL